MSSHVSRAAGWFACVWMAAVGVSNASFQSGQLHCVDEGASIVIVGCEFGSVNLVIPDLINGKPVTRISSGAFMAKTSLESVAIAESVTSIDDAAFNNCYNLSSVNLPSGLSHLGARAFSNCWKLASPITIPSGVTVIEAETFSSCGSLQTINLHPGVTQIGAGAFEGCAIKTFSTPPKVTVFTERMLLRADLESLTIPKHVTRIEKEAIAGTNLRSIVIPEHVDFVLDSAFSSSPNLQSVRILGKWNTIAPSMFSNCLSLRTFVAPPSVLSVGEGAFERSGLVSIKLPAVRTIGNRAFDGCRDLAVVSLSKNLQSIGSTAFRDCKTLQGLHFTGNAPKMGVGVFLFAHPRTVFYVEEASKGFTYPRWYGHRVSLPRGEIDIYTDDGPLDTEGKAVLKAGSVRVGTLGAPQVIFIRNTGNRPLTGVRASVSGEAAREFPIRSIPPMTIQPGQSVRLVIAFRPAKAMKRQATLVIESADLDEGFIEVALSGTGITLL